MPSKPTDLTVQVLREIRDEIRNTNTRLGRLETRPTESETRLASELVAVVHAVDKVKDVLVQRLDLKQQVDEHERRLTALEQRQSH